MTEAFDPQTIARRFVQARLSGDAITEYPGLAPQGPQQAYACQEAAIGLWPDQVAGWKVGRIPAPFDREYGADRLAGPIFTRHVWAAEAGGPVPFPVIEGGFSAVEAEFVFRLLADAPVDKPDWSREEALALDWEVLLGVEIAGSPFAGINDLGPGVTISDFGNNAGVILGETFSDWRAQMDSVACEAFIDGRSVGRGAAPGLPGGPMEGVRFLLENCARRGRPLRAGQLVSSGALTGVHRIGAGQPSRLVFGDLGEIQCLGVPARPEAVST